MQGPAFKARVNAAAIEERPADVCVLSDGLRGNETHNTGHSGKNRTSANFYYLSY